MDSMRRDILLYLRCAKAPITAQVVARTVATPADINLVYSHLGHLVRAGAVTRQHHPDGMLRYAIAGDGEQSAKSFAPPNARPPVKRHRPAPLADIVFAAMGDEAMSVAEIHAACKGQLTVKQVSNLLQLLKQRGQVSKTYGYQNAQWIRTEQLATVDQVKRAVIITISDDDIDSGAITINLTFDPPIEADDRQTPATAAALAAFEHLQSRSTVLSERAG
jgi:Fe2+ or Zn2+ uptake regulation protein